MVKQVTHEELAAAGNLPEGHGGAVKDVLVAEQPTEPEVKEALAADPDINTDSAGNVTGARNHGGHAATQHHQHAPAGGFTEPDFGFVQGTPAVDGAGPLVHIPDHIAANYRERLHAEFDGDWNRLADYLRGLARGDVAFAALARWATAQGSRDAQLSTAESRAELAAQLRAAEHEHDLARDPDEPSVPAVDARAAASAEADIAVGEQAVKNYTAMVAERFDGDWQALADYLRGQAGDDPSFGRLADWAQTRAPAKATPARRDPEEPEKRTTQEPEKPRTTTPRRPGRPRKTV